MNYLDKNIIFFFSQLDGGGGLTFTKSIYLKIKNINFFICSIKNNSKSNYIIKENNFKKLNLLQAFIKKNKICVFNSQLSLLLSFFNIFGRNIYIPHGAGNNFKFFNRIRKLLFIIQINSPWIDNVIACGISEFDNLKEIIYLKKSKLLNINISVHPNLYNLKNQTSKPFKYKLCFIGKIIPQKGIDLLLKALNNLDNGNLFTIRLYTNLNSPNNSKNFKYFNLVKDLISSSKAKILVNDPMPVNLINFNEFDFIVIPSRFEGLPSLIIELGMNNIPMIVSDCDGIKELFEKNDLFMFENLNYIDLSRILKSINKNYIYVDKVTTTLKNKLIKDYSYSKFIDSYLNLFKQ